MPAISIGAKVTDTANTYGLLAALKFEEMLNFC